MEEMHLRQLQINSVHCCVADTCREQGRFLISQGKWESIGPEACCLQYVLTLTCIFANRFLHKTGKAESRRWARITSTKDGVYNLCIGPAIDIAEWGQEGS